MILKVGLTGGIGAGKTTVAKIFEGFGIPIFYADREAKKLLHENKILKNEIIALFGENSYQGKHYHSSYIAAIVFSNKEMLTKLNNLVHPYVLQSFIEWAASQNDKPYVIKEAALILNSDTRKALDYIILVNTDIEQRIERISKRDSLQREMILKRMESQLAPESMIKMADSIISNNEDDLLIPQVLAIHEKLVNLHKIS
jgi:dephospho-CoA kinase